MAKKKFPSRAEREAINAETEAKWRRAFRDNNSDDDDDDGYSDSLWDHEEDEAFNARDRANRGVMRGADAGDYAESPLAPLRGLLAVGTVVGAFPASVGERTVNMALSGWKVAYSAAFLALWTAAGLAAAAACQFESGEAFSSVFEVKPTVPAAMRPAEMDRVLLCALPFASLAFLAASVALSWSRISRYSGLCYDFCTRGFVIRDSPESRTMAHALADLVLFAVGQTLVVVHRANVFCPDPDKKVVFAVVVSLWLVPLYLAVTFSGNLFLQFGYSLAEYFEEMSREISRRNKQIHQKNATVKEMVHRGLPRRYDRLHNCVDQMEDAFSGVCFAEVTYYSFMAPFMLYFTMSSVLSGGREGAFPWWAVGYFLLTIHHLLRIYQLSNVGGLVTSEVSHVLTMLAQFSFIHGNQGLLCFAVARRPPPAGTASGGSLTAGGFWRLEKPLTAGAATAAAAGAAVLMHFRLAEMQHG